MTASYVLLTAAAVALVGAVTLAVALPGMSRRMVVRQGLRFLLDQEDGIEVVGECADGIEAAAAVARLAPDVVLLDLLMPGPDGVTVLTGIKRDQPATAVIVLTSLTDDAHLLAAVRAGAASYLPKTSGRPTWSPPSAPPPAARASWTRGSPPA